MCVCVCGTLTMSLSNRMIFKSTTSGLIAKIASLY